MLKLVVLGIVTFLAKANTQQHPINSVIVEEIKSKNTTWTPVEALDNPLAQ